MKKYSLVYTIQDSAVELGGFSLKAAEEYKKFLREQGVTGLIDILQDDDSKDNENWRLWI